MLTLLSLGSAFLFENEILIQGSSFVSAIYASDVVVGKTVLAKHRDTREPFPFSGVSKLSAGVYSIGGEYEDRVVARLAKELGIGKAEAGERFSSQAPSGMHRVINPLTGKVSKFVLESDKVPGQYYWRFYITNNPKCRSEVHWFDHTNSEIAIDGGYLAKRSNSAKQRAAGIEVEVRPFAVKFQNIRGIKHGEHRFVNYPEYL